MELDSRKLAILATIIDNYIKTGEPIGSKHLSQMLDISLSPATIRNEMASLFDMGLLEQPHTSAGRVPSHMGYRVYIDRLMNPMPLSPEEKAEIDALFNRSSTDPENLLEGAAKALAQYTGCATISSAVTPDSVTVKRIEIIQATSSSVVIVLIASNGVIKNKVCRVSFNVNPEIVDFFNRFANGRLAGKTFTAITSSYLTSLAISLGEYSRLFTPIFTAIYDLCRELGDGTYYLNGSTNLLSYSELSQIAHALLTFLGDRSEISHLLNSDNTGSTTQITIGRENQREPLADSSVVITRYKIGEHNSGAIGIIGPVRLNYSKIIPHLEYFAKILSELLSDAYEEK